MTQAEDLEVAAEKEPKEDEQMLQRAPLSILAHIRQKSSTYPLNPTLTNDKQQRVHRINIVLDRFQILPQSMLLSFCVVLKALEERIIRRCRDERGCESAYPLPDNLQVSINSIPIRRVDVCPDREHLPTDVVDQVSIPRRSRFPTYRPVCKPFWEAIKRYAEYPLNTLLYIST